MKTERKIEMVSKYCAVSDLLFVSILFLPCFCPILLFLSLSLLTFLSP